MCPLLSEPESKLKFEEEEQLCNYNDFVHVYHFVATGASVWGSNWEDGTRSFFVKHKSGYYVYSYTIYDFHACRLYDWSFIRYSKSWSSLYYRKFTKEERTTIKNPPLVQILRKDPCRAHCIERCATQRIICARFVSHGAEAGVGAEV